MTVEGTISPGEQSAEAITLDPGYYHITFSAEGYQSASANAHIVDGLTTEVNITLEPEEQQGPEPQPVTTGTLSVTVTPNTVIRTVRIMRID